MRALVAGGAGFVGAALVERLLAEQWQVEVVDDLSHGSLDRLAAARADRSNVLRIHRHDVVDPTTPELVERIAPDRIWNLTAVPNDASPARTVEVASVGTVHLLEGAARLAEPPKTIVALSGPALHAGATADDLPVRESDPPLPLGPSGLAAVNALSALTTYRNGRGVEYTALVLADVYGPGADPRRCLPAALVAGSSAGEAVAIAAAPRSYDLLHVDDAVDALARAGERADGLVLHVASGVETTAGQLVEVLRSLGRDVAVKPELELGPDEARRMSLDPSRAAIHLGWTPFTPLDEGLRSLLTAPH